MGGIKSATIAVNCDRCKKDVPVEDEEQIKFYQTWAKRGDGDDRMFIAIINGNVPDGAPRSMNFEYLCPKCVDDINGLFDKIEMKKKTGGKKPKKASEPKVEAPPPATAAETEDDPPPPAAPPPDAAPAPDDYDDDELFDG